MKKLVFTFAMVLNSCGQEHGASTLMERPNKQIVDLTKPYQSTALAGGELVEVDAPRMSNNNVQVFLKDNQGKPKVTALPNHEKSHQCLVARARSIDLRESRRRYEVVVEYEFNWDDGVNACVFKVEQLDRKPLYLRLWHFIDL